MGASTFLRELLSYNSLLSEQFIFLEIYAYTEFTDKNLIGMVILFQTNWFGLTETMPWLFAILAAYFVIASVVSFVFVRSFAKADYKNAVSFG